MKNKSKVSELQFDPQEIAKMIERERIKQLVTQECVGMLDIACQIKEFRDKFNLNDDETRRYLGIIRVSIQIPVFGLKRSYIERSGFAYSRQTYETVKYRSLDESGLAVILCNDKIVYDSANGVSVDPFVLTNTVPLIEDYE